MGPAGASRIPAARITVWQYVMAQLHSASRSLRIFVLTLRVQLLLHAFLFALMTLAFLCPQ